LDLQLQYILN